VRVLVCGGRDYSDLARVFEIMKQVNPSEVVTGGAPGADTLANSWAIQNRVDHRVYYADWDRYGKSAGPIRNQWMLLESKPDLVLAFPGGTGTADMMRRAELAGIVVQVVPPR
jgi:hypothetical protein